MSLRIITVREIAYASRPVHFPRPAPFAEQLIIHQNDAHDGVFNPACPACREIKAKAEAWAVDTYRRKDYSKKGGWLSKRLLQS